MRILFLLLAPAVLALPGDQEIRDRLQSFQEAQPRNAKNQNGNLKESRILKLAFNGWMQVDIVDHGPFNVL